MHTGEVEKKNTGILKYFSDLEARRLFQNDKKKSVFFPLVSRINHCDCTMYILKYNLKKSPIISILFSECE